jgi:PAS domain S-box-containing protein
MSLRVKSLLVTSVTMVILMVLLYVLARLIVTDGYTRLEEQDTRAHVERASNALTNDRSTLERTANDYAAWDETYTFMRDRTPDYLGANFPDATFINSRLSLVILIDTQGQIVFAKAFDLDRNEELPVSPQWQTLTAQDEALLQPTHTLSPTTGIWLSPDGPYLIASDPILTSEGTGPSRGALIMARALTEAEIARLSDITQLQLAFLDLRDASDPQAQAMRATLSDQQPIVVRPASEQLVQGFTLVKDIYDQPALVLRVDYPRDIYQQGQQTLTYLLLALLVSGLLVGGTLVLLLERTIIARLGQLNREVHEIGASSNASQRVSAQGRDEVGSLASEINHALESLDNAQHLLRQREREALTLLDSLPAYAFFKDAHGYYVAANQRFCEALHRTREAIAGKTDRDFYSPERAERYQADDAFVMERGEVREVGEETIGSGPDAIVLATKKVPVKDDVGRVIGLIGLAFDVTDRKRAAQELAVARDQAVEALRFKSQLLAHVSHDLRTPINAILGYAEMLEADVYGPLSEEQRQPLVRIKLSCNQLARMVSDLLSQSRLEAGKQTLVNRPFAPANLIDAIKTVTAPIAQDKQLEFHCQVDPEAPAEVWGDYDRLYQVVLNLVDNALKFTEHGAIDLRVARLDADHYTIAVSDTGQGIPADEQALVFEAFRQGSAPAQGRYKGVGLGLSIVRQLTVLMGGEISLTSQPDQGSTFTITLPVTLAHEDIA